MNLTVDPDRTRYGCDERGPLAEPAAAAPSCTPQVTQLQWRAMTVRRTISALLVALALGLAPAAARADGWVTVRYTGTFDQSFVYQPSNPSVWQSTLHFTWDEREVFHLTTPGRVRSEGLQISIGGKETSTYAPPNTAQDCSFGIAPRPRAPSPILPTWTGGAVGIVALMPITGTYAMSTSPTSPSPSCAIPKTGGAGVGTIPPSVMREYTAAEDPGITAELGRPPVTRRFDADGKSADGKDTASIHATMTVSNSARRPPAAGTSPPPVTPARKRAKIAALEALRDTLQRALYPCGVGAGVGTALLAAGPVGLAVGGTMTALGTPLCLAYLKTIKDEADTVADPPVPSYRVAARIQPVRAAAVKLPACTRSRGAGSPGAVCRRLQPAVQKLLRATRGTGAAAAAIDTTIGRETAALAAHDRTATALQDRTLATLGRSFSARRRAETTAARTVARILRSAGLDVRLDAAAGAAALSTLQRRLVAAGLPAAKLRTALGGAPQVTATDLLTALDG